MDLQTAAAVPSLLAQTEDAPVAVIRGATADAAPPVEGPVVVGVDGSPTSDAAIATAFDEASWRGAELVAVHAWLEYASDHVLSPGLDEGWEQAEQELLAERLASSCCVRPNGLASGVVRPDRTVSFDGGCDSSTAPGSEHDNV